MALSQTPPSPTPAPDYHTKYRITIAVLAIAVFILGVATANSISQNSYASSYASSQLDSYRSQVDSLQSQLNGLRSQVSQLQTAKLKGDFWWFNDCPLYSNCSYIINGAYTNMGSVTANNARVTFTIYSGPQGTGQVLCTTTYLLRNVPGETIESISEVTCAGASSTPGDTMGSSFNWT